MRGYVGLSCFFLVLWLAHSQEPSPPGPAPSPQPLPQPSVGAAKDASGSGISAELQSYIEPFLYDMRDRKDPFRPFFEEGGANNEGDFEGPLMPLQRYDIDEIRLIGIIWDVKEPKAMFMDPNSQIHILSREERIGRNNGYLAVIREGEVVVIENIKAKGEMIRTPRVMKISR